MRTYFPYSQRKMPTQITVASSDAIDTETETSTLEDGQDTGIQPVMPSDPNIPIANLTNNNTLADDSTDSKVTTEPVVSIPATVISNDDAKNVDAVAPVDRISNNIVAVENGNKNITSSIQVNSIKSQTDPAQVNNSISNVSATIPAPSAASLQPIQNVDSPTEAAIPPTVQINDSTKGTTINSMQSAIVQRTDVCGNGICSKDENCKSCPQDCQTPWKGPYSNAKPLSFARDCIASNPYLSQCQSGNKVVLLASVVLQESNSTLPITKITELFKNIPVTYLIFGNDMDSSTKPSLLTILNNPLNSIALNLGKITGPDRAKVLIDTYYPEFQNLNKKNILNAVNIVNINQEFSETINNMKLILGLDAPKNIWQVRDRIDYMRKNEGRSFYLNLNAHSAKNYKLLKSTISLLKKNGIQIVGPQNCDVGDTYEGKELHDQTITVGSNISDANSLNGFYILLLFVVFTHFH
eukprot:NODE_285_length_11794_cov_0.197178.p4 type:complete len:468 gc:universal NODE_285_length_11794_cov_0.197178:2711-4114(+)